MKNVNLLEKNVKIGSFVKKCYEVACFITKNRLTY